MEELWPIVTKLISCKQRILEAALSKTLLIIKITEVNSFHSVLGGGGKGFPKELGGMKGVKKPGPGPTTLPSPTSSTPGSLSESQLPLGEKLPVVLP